MQLQDFILRLNTYSRVDHDLPINRLIYYDLNHNRREIFSCNFYFRPAVWNDLLFSFDNHCNLLLTNNEYNNGLYMIVNVKRDYYAYYHLSHRYSWLTFVIFKVYSPGAHYVFDVGRKTFFKCDCDRPFSTAWWAAYRPCFDLLSPKYVKMLNFNHIRDDLFLAIARLNSLVEPHKLLYVMR